MSYHGSGSGFSAGSLTRSNRRLRPENGSCRQ